jgi:hypothetical protein
MDARGKLRRVRRRTLLKFPEAFNPSPTLPQKAHPGALRRGPGLLRLYGGEGPAAAPAGAWAASGPQPREDAFPRCRCRLSGSPSCQLSSFSCSSFSHPQANPTVTQASIPLPQNPTQPTKTQTSRHQHKSKTKPQHRLRNRPTATPRLRNRQDVVDRPFATVTYTEAVKLLKSSGHKFEYPVSWGLDLQSEHERFLSETVRSSRWRREVQAGGGRFSVAM